MTPSATNTREVAAAGELLAAVGDSSALDIRIAGPIADLPSIRLLPGQTLRSADRQALRFATGQDGVELTTGNSLEGLDLFTDPDRRAVFNADTVRSMGRTALRDLTVRGCVRILARGAIRSGHVDAVNVDVVEADARGFAERPSGFGVEVQPGAFTLWNLSDDPDVRLSANLSVLAAGRDGAPVRGSGIFVGGTPGGGELHLACLDTGDIHSDGGIAPGTVDRISGGVFVSTGAMVGIVRNRGSVTTYGANDMVLDNWGTVDRWTADLAIRSHGPSGIGFVNFGSIDELRILAPIETSGQGARGLNVYAGTIRSLDLDRVTTRADGAVGVQISQPIGRLLVRRGIETFGGTGDSLVKGVVRQLAAIPLSIKPGGSIRELIVRGGLVAHGDAVAPIELHGSVDLLSVCGGTSALGSGFAGL